MIDKSSLQLFDLRLKLMIVFNSVHHFAACVLSVARKLWI